jgi:excisionase family DNA binding protein
VRWAVLPDRLLTTRDVCELLGVHRETVRRWANDGRLPRLRLGPGRRVRFREEDVAALIRLDNNGALHHKARRVNGAAEPSGATPTAVRTGRHGPR